MATEHQKRSAHQIIHGCTVASAAAAGAWASVPILGPFGMGADTPVLASLTAGMIVGLGELFGHPITQKSALAVAANLFGLVFGTQLARGLASLIPGVGTVANAAAVYNLQEAIGWAIFYAFDEGLSPESLAAEEIVKRMNNRR